MKRPVVILINAVFAVTMHSSAARLAEWNFDGRAGKGTEVDASSKNAAVESAELEVGSTLSVLDRTDALAVRGLVQTTSEGDADDNETYISLNIEPASGLSIQYSVLKLYHHEVNNNGSDMTVFVRSSVDQFTATLDSITLPNQGPLTEDDLDIRAIGTQAGPVEIRLYFYTKDAEYGYDTAYQLGKGYNKDGHTDVELIGEVVIP